MKTGPVGYDNLVAGKRAHSSLGALVALALDYLIVLMVILLAVLSVGGVGVMLYLMR